MSTGEKKTVKIERLKLGSLLMKEKSTSLRAGTSSEGNRELAADQSMQWHVSHWWKKIVLSSIPWVQRTWERWDKRRPPCY